ncbi:MAG: SDR family NAD(P)-dependent oxidoreductase [Endomicrobiaceae bacterium]|nr:SDR family NAD(P)-dependent oxidoreductase [Endomicrobiaceae bacterium]
MKILLTGATGFVGSHIVEELISNNHSVIATIRKTSNPKWIKDYPVQFEYCSLNDEENLSKLVSSVDIIIHCAGVVRALNWDGYYNTNVTGTQNLVQVALKNKSNIKKFIYISSQAAMGPSSSEQPKLLSEKENPVSYYGKSKLLAEQEVKKLEGQIPYTIIRPASVYGPRDKDILIFFNLVKHHLKPNTYTKRFIQLVFVKDIAKVISTVLSNGNTNNKTYYLCDGNIYSWKDVATTIAKTNKIKTMPVVLFDFIFKTVAFFYEIVAKITKKPQVLSKEKIVEMLQTYWTADNSDIIKDTNFEFTKLENGAKITYNWYLSNKYF